MTRSLAARGLAVPLFALLTSIAAMGAPALDPEQIGEATLDNGLHIVVKRVPQWGLVSVGLCIKAAPLYELEDQHGLADVVRHMICEVAPDQQPSLGETIRDLGCEFNSYTSPDATQIRATVSSYSLPELFPRLVKAVFEPTFDEAVWARELPKLRRRMMDSERTPINVLWRSVWQTAFRKHPYRRRVAATPDVVTEYNTGDLAAFHGRLYVPNNVAIVAVGDIDLTTMTDLARTHLGKYERGELRPPPVAQEPPLSDPRTHLEKVPARHTVLSYAWHAAGIDNKRDVCALDLIYAILGEGQTARLMQAFAQQDEIDAVPEVEFITKRDPGLFLITCITKSSAEFETRETILAQIEKLREEKVSQKELDNAKHLIRAGYTIDNASFANQVGSMAFYEAIDSYQFAVEYLDEIQQVTVDDIQRVTRSYLGPSNYVLAIVRPKTSNRPTREARLTQ